MRDGRYPTIKAIEDWKIRNGDIAQIAGVLPCRVSDYTSSKPVTELIASRIEAAVADILRVWKTFAPIKIALDDPTAFAKAVELANQVHAKLAAEIAQEDVLRDLPTDLPELRIKPVEQSGTAAD